MLSSNATKKLVLVSGRSYPALAKDIASHLGIEVLKTTLYDFADGEIYCRYTQSVRGDDVFVFQTHCQPINKWIMEQLIMIDALKRASVRSITAVIPFLGYSRQDKKHLGREPISCKLVMDLLTAAGVNRVMSVDLHSAQIQGFFNGPVDHLQAMPTLVSYIKESMKGCNLAIVSPDAGRIKVSEQWSNRLGGVPLIFLHKTRDITRPNVTVSKEVVGNVSDKDCVIVDDIIDTGGTIIGAVKSLRAAGARSVTVVATHALLNGNASQDLANCGAREVVVTNTVPVPEEKRFKNLTVLSIAPVLAKAMKAVFEHNSVAGIFEEGA